MFKHLLVPLDGSHLAEAVLPAAAAISRACGASVTLIHIIERDPPKEIHGERHLTNRDEALAYLSEVAARAFGPDTQVEKRVHTHVHTEKVNNITRSIVEHATDEMGSDLIILCAHGRGGLRDWMFGRIAQQVIARGRIPVLMIQPTESGDAPPFSLHKLLVPLDGNPDHEQGLPTAAAMADVCGAALHLVMVVPTLSTLPGEYASTAMLLPGSTSATLDMAEEGAAQYLQEQVAKLKAGGLRVTAEVQRGDPAEVITRTAVKVNASLIVMGTHGRAGTEAFWSGSVAPKVSSRSRLPVLLVRVREGESEK